MFARRRIDVRKGAVATERKAFRCRNRGGFIDRGRAMRRPAGLSRLAFGTAQTMPGAFSAALNSTFSHVASVWPSAIASTVAS